MPNLRGKTKADDNAINVVIRDRKAMPGFENSFDKTDARRVLRYMQTLGTKKPPAPEEPVEDELPDEPTEEDGDAQAQEPGDPDEQE